MLPKTPSQANKRPFAGEVFTELFLKIDWPQKMRRDCVQNTLHQSMYLKPQLQTQLVLITEDRRSPKEKEKMAFNLSS